MARGRSAWSPTSAGRSADQSTDLVPLTLPEIVPALAKIETAVLGRELQDCISIIVKSIPLPKDSFLGHFAAIHPCKRSLL